MAPTAPPVAREMMYVTQPDHRFPRPGKQMIDETGPDSPSFVETMVPEGMKGNMAIFKKAAFSGQETGKCKKYRCVPPKLM